MMKLSKKADYALIAVKHLATHGADGSHSATDIAEACGLSGDRFSPRCCSGWPSMAPVVARHGSSGDQLARHPG